MSGASMEDERNIREKIARLPPWLRLRLLSFLGKYCRKCGRIGKKEAHGYGVTAFSCEGGSPRTTLHHERIEWECEL